MNALFSLFSRRPAAPEASPPDPSPAVNGTVKSTDPHDTAGISRGLRIGKMQGGAGGRGGLATDSVTGPGQGGRGGQGGEALINHQNENSRMEIGEFEGGTGGEGGGGAIAGDGGGGGRAIIKGDEETLLAKSRSPGSNLTIHEFGAKYSLNEGLVNRLSDSGYDTAGSLRFATVSDLKEDGFKQGHINQVRHALDTWSPKT